MKSCCIRGRGLGRFVSSSLPRVLVVGSGWGGNKVARKLDKTKFLVRVVSPSNHFLFTPMLPSAAVGTLEFRAIQEPVRTIPGVEYFQAKAVAIENGVVRCRDVFSGAGFDLAYDFLIVAAGCKTNTFGTPGVDDERPDVCFLKNLYHARKIRNRVIECFERASNPATSEEEREKLVSFVVVGGGATSCEFASELSDFVKEDVARWYPRLATRVRISLIEAGPKILSSFDSAMAGYYSNFLKRRHVDVRTGVSIVEIDDNTPRAFLNNGDSIDFGLLVWSAGLAPVDVVEKQPWRKDERGRVLVDDYLRVLDEDRIFAIGDCAVQENRPYLPPTASVAEQHAAYLGACFNSSYYAAAADGSGPLPVPKPVAPAAMPTVYLEFLDALLFSKSPEFRYVERGSMASAGFGRGILDLSKTDLPSGPRISGFAAFVAWRGAYLSKQLSLANMILVPMYYVKTFLFGRDISRF
ncbi:hypothetical protein CTAYLR_008620 [Chrysophaeum taylorii]|uniref:NADH:ubiquinone reductase (non-electrogenic) n=1 Tax=Chrysophaeum taylorii TaxID=2483200 RepID=A0AAD7XMM5_9STRA|nr:hypothetical protein CTAYLR_008620 [Chrysophaeum taylorii]